MKRITSGTTSRIDLREQVLNFPSQPVITKDNVTIDIDAVLYYRVADPQKATYAIQNLPYALETLTRTTLRNIVGDIELDQTLASRDMINKRMRDVIEEASIGWGVDVTRVELQAIEPPRDIQQSMELQMRAERERRAAVTNAEAGKRAAILEAEGLRRSRRCAAPRAKRKPRFSAPKGLATARLAMAEAEAEAIQRIAASLPEGQAAMYLLGMKYLEALPQLTQGKGSTIFSPPKPRASWAHSAASRSCSSAHRAMLRPRAHLVSPRPGIHRSVHRSPRPRSRDTPPAPPSRPTRAARGREIACGENHP